MSILKLGNRAIACLRLECSKIVYAIAENFDTIHHLWGCHSGVNE
ncbi:hypothetical protein [Fischerella thermalis]|nr:hypothetical protein [Fischerella thermalis]